MLASWAYGALYGTNRERTAALDGWRTGYDHHDDTALHPGFVLTASDCSP